MPRRLSPMFAAALLPLLAQALGVGDPAPPLKTGGWAQGEPVAALEKGTVYVVEFWATWCGPCVATIPHLNELHVQFKDKGLVVIGQNVWERDTDKVAPFIQKMGDKMTYRVALDDTEADEKGVMAKTWMEAAKQRGIPAAFVVDKKGVIAWIGHPARLNAEILQAVLDGAFDPKKAAADREREDKSMQAGREAFLKFITALRDENFDEAAAVVAELEKSGDETLVDIASGMRKGLCIQRKDWPGLQEHIRAEAKKAGDDEAKYNELAWQLVATPGFDQPDLALADKLASRANELAQGGNAAILDTLARVRFMQGKKEEAIGLEEKALALGGNDKHIFELTLAFYRRGELPTARQLNEAETKARKARAAPDQQDDRPGEDI